MNTFPCPHCGKTVELNEALTHQLEEKIVKQQEEKHKLEIEKTIKETQLRAEKTAREQINKELLVSKNANEKLIEDLTRLKKEQEENERKRKEEEEQIRKDAVKKAEEDQVLKLKEKDLQLDQIKKANEDIRRANEELKRKLEQGSQQMQGEVLELDLEEKLKTLFPYDNFIPVPKGVEGADIWQEVKNKHGNVAGSILWETKRTKSWSKQWLVKLREDTRRINASECILVSQVLPDDIKSFKRIDGVWVTSYEYALNLAEFIRFLMLSVAIAKASATHEDEELKAIYDYIMSDAFRHKFEAHYEIVNALRDELLAERRSTELRWKKRDAYIAKLDRNTTAMYGELQNVIPNLPSLKSLESETGANNLFDE
jgi:hypothetical protein